MFIRYVGPFADGVEIAATGDVVLPDEVVEVDDELGASLATQAVWEAVAVSTPNEKEGK